MIKIDGSKGEGGGQTCADVIDAFVSERAPDENGIVRCTDTRRARATEHRWQFEVT